MRLLPTTWRPRRRHGGLARRHYKHRQRHGSGRRQASRVNARGSSGKGADGFPRRLCRRFRHVGRGERAGADRLVLHAAGLRPGADQPQHPDARRPLGPRHRCSISSRAFSTCCAARSWCRLGTHLDEQLTPLVHAASRFARRCAAPRGRRHAADARRRCRSAGSSAARARSRYSICRGCRPTRVRVSDASHSGRDGARRRHRPRRLDLPDGAADPRFHQTALKAAGARMAIADANVRNAEVLNAMGMGRRAVARYQRANAAYLESQARASDIGGSLAGVSKVARMILQSRDPGCRRLSGRRGQLTAGAIIAASIASSRALATYRARHRALEKLYRRPSGLCSSAESARRPRCRERDAAHVAGACEHVSRSKG